MIIICTGSRDLGHPGVVEDVLGEIHEVHGDGLYIRVGCNKKGLDARVRDWCYRTWRTRWREHCRVYVAEWDIYRDMAGPIRNREMVGDGADACLGWLQEGAGNRGTIGCMTEAHEAMISTWQWKGGEQHGPHGVWEPFLPRTVHGARGQVRK